MCSFCDTRGKGWTSIPPPDIVTPELALAVQETEVCTFSHVEALPGPTNYVRVKFRWLAHCRPSSISSVLCVLFKKARWALIVDSLWLIGRTFGCSIPSVVSSGPIGETWPSTRRMKKENSWHYYLAKRGGRGLTCLFLELDFHI